VKTKPARVLRLTKVKNGAEPRPKIMGPKSKAKNSGSRVLELLVVILVVRKKITAATPAMPPATPSFSR
jgi:hypothetical protein